jgi:translation initiation factor IF-2
MEQRQVRLGDVLDDYCTRERRVTNHAVVALVGSEVKLTRCTTCDSEHPYKAAKVPPRRLTKLVAAPSTASSTAPPDGPAPAPQAADAGADADVGTPLAPAPRAAAPVAPDASAAPAEVAPSPEPGGSPMELRIHSVRRPLIRATLERPEGAPPPARQAPVFTIRENQSGGNERGGRPARKGRGGGRPGAEANGNRAEGHQGHQGHQGQSARPASGKNGAKSSRARGGGSRPDRSDRPDRANRPPRSRGKGRSN